MTRPRQWDEARIAEASDLAASGATRVRAAEVLGVTPGALSGACHRYNIRFAADRPGRPAPRPPLCLAQEIAAARAEAATTPPYRSSQGWPP